MVRVLNKEHVDAMIKALTSVGIKIKEYADGMAYAMLLPNGDKYPARKCPWSAIRKASNNNLYIVKCHDDLFC